MIVNAAKDGSIHALALIIASKIHPKSENFIKTICLGGNTDALVNEIAKNLHTKRQTIIKRLIINKEIRKPSARSQRTDISIDTFQRSCHSCPNNDHRSFLHLGRQNRRYGLVAQDILSPVHIVIFDSIRRNRAEDPRANM